MTQPSKGKRLYLINRDFQLRYTRIAVIVGFVSTLVTIVLILYPLFQFRIVRFPMFLPSPFIWAIAGAALFNFLIIALMGVLVTHRIAGPMFSLVRHIHSMQSGKLAPPLRVRDGDDLKYLVRNYNEMVAYLTKVTGSDMAQLEAIVASLKQGRQDEAIAAAEALLNQIAGRLAPAPGVPQ